LLASDLNEQAAGLRLRLGLGGILLTPPFRLALASGGEKFLRLYFLFLASLSLRGKG